jgi:hypothetical protein
MTNFEQLSIILSKNNKKRKEFGISSKCSIQFELIVVLKTGDFV